MAGYLFFSVVLLQIFECELISLTFTDILCCNTESCARITVYICRKCSTCQCNINTIWALCCKTRASRGFTTVVVLLEGVQTVKISLTDTTTGHMFVQRFLSFQYFGFSCHSSNIALKSVTEGVKCSLYCGRSWKESKQHQPDHWSLASLYWSDCLLHIVLCCNQSGIVVAQLTGGLVFYLKNYTFLYPQPRIFCQLHI